MASTEQMLLESILPQLLTVALPTVAVAAVIMWVLGRASLKVLREVQEPLRHREEMQWGARWYWALMTAALLLPAAATVVALTQAVYPTTVAMVGALSIAPIGFALHWMLPWQFHGAILWLMVRRHGDEAVRVIEAGECVCGGWGPWVHRTVAALFIALMVWAASSTIPLDREIMRFERADRLGAQIAEGIGSSKVVGAHVIFDGMLPRAAGNRVLIEVEEGAPEDVVRNIVDTAAPHLRELLPAGEWTVRAWSEDGGKATRTITSGGEEDLDT